MKEIQQKGAEGFKEALNAASLTTEGIEFKEDTKVMETFAKLGVGKIIICDDARAFDLRNVEQMREEGRVICEVDMDEVLQGERKPADVKEDK